MGWIVIIVLSIVVVAGIAIKLYVSRSGGADISQAQLHEWKGTEIRPLHPRRSLRP